MESRRLLFVHPLKSPTRIEDSHLLRVTTTRPDRRRLNETHFSKDRASAHMVVLEDEFSRHSGQTPVSNESVIFHAKVLRRASRI